MSNSLLHDHSCYLHTMFAFGKFSNQVYLERRPLLLENGQLGIQFDLKSMELSYFQILVLFDIPAFYAYA